MLTTFDLDEYVDVRARRRRRRASCSSRSTRPRCSRRCARWRRGDGVLAPEVTRRVISRLAAPARRPAPPPPASTTSPPARPTCSTCLGRGLSNAEIAAELVITEATTKTHVSRVLTKLGLRSRVQAAIAAQDAGPSELG